ncbi:MAG: hypothetical protein O6945_10230 [Gammaproteobacteria bacterium]|nr:hypothetical protein [Gammaproteobacteria bacterium]
MTDISCHPGIARNLGDSSPGLGWRLTGNPVINWPKGLFGMLSWEYLYVVGGQSRRICSDDCGRDISEPGAEVIA